MGAAPVAIEATITAQQPVSLGGGGVRFVTIPAEANSTPNISVSSSADCPMPAPLNANCAKYTLVVPASNPSVGQFSAGKTIYAPPPAGNVLFTVRADAFNVAAGDSDCMPSSKTTTLDASGNPLKVTAGATSTAMEIDFSGCS